MLNSVVSDLCCYSHIIDETDSQLGTAVVFVLFKTLTALNKMTLLPFTRLQFCVADDFCHGINFAARYVHCYLPMT